MISPYILKISTDDSILKKLDARLNDNLLRGKANALEKFFLSIAFLVLSLLSVITVIMVHLIACGKVIRDDKTLGEER